MQLPRALLLAGLLSGQALALTSKEVVSGIDDISDQSRALKDPVKNLKPWNIVENAPKIIDGLRNIISDLGKYNSKWSLQSMCGPMHKQPVRALPDGPPWNAKEDAQPICDAFRTFVTVHQELLGVIIGERGTFSGTPFTAPMAGVLRALEGNVDTTAFTIINLVPYCEKDASEDRYKIDKTLSDAVKQYSMPALPNEVMEPGYGERRRHPRLSRQAVDDTEGVYINVEM